MIMAFDVASIPTELIPGTPFIELACWEAVRNHITGTYLCWQSDTCAAIKSSSSIRSREDLLIKCSATMIVLPTLQLLGMVAMFPCVLAQETVLPYSPTVIPHSGETCPPQSIREETRYNITEEIRFIFRPADPVWDGMGCSSTSTCCTFNSPPWFTKNLRTSIQLTIWKWGFAKNMASMIHR